MERHIAAMIKLMLWYQSDLAPTRVSFAGGVVAGSLITLVVGLLHGFNYDSALWGAIISIVLFVVMVFFAGTVFKLGKKYGDRKAICDILKESEKEEKNDSTNK
jgi:hypothetical protein